MRIAMATGIEGFRIAAAFLLIASAAGLASAAPQAPIPNEPTPNLPNPVPTDNLILNGVAQPIDLNTALRLAGVQNPQLLISRQLVVEAVLEKQFAAVQILPTLNGGGSFDSHTGNLQQSSGNILSVNRSQVYVGAGANAVAAGTVGIPGVVLSGNPAEGLFRFLVTRQIVVQREFSNAAERNQVLLRVCLAYSELLRATGQRAIYAKVRDQAEDVARTTAAYARIGQGRQADADRANAEMARRRADFRRAEGDMLGASARLCRVLNLDPSTRLEPTDAYAVPIPIVPDPVPLCELIALAITRRPELGERRAAIKAALLGLDGARVLPFSPTVLFGYSSGGEAGGSNLVRPIFGNFGGRADFDALAYWSLQNLGVGNVALIRIAKANVKTNELRQLAILDMVRDEVAEAYARSHARFAQIGDEEAAVRSSIDGFARDLERIKQGVPGRGDNPRPIEVLDSLRLLGQSQIAYLNAIVEYNRAHFELYVAMGQPPANALAHPVPVDGVEPGMTRAPASATAPPPPPNLGIGAPFAPPDPVKP